MNYQISNGYNVFVETYAKLVICLQKHLSSWKVLYTCTVLQKLFSKRTILKVLKHFLLHLMFWCLVLLFFTYFYGAESKNYNDAFLFSLFLMPITIATTYISIYKLIPDYLITKRYFQFVLYSIYTWILSFYLIMLSIFFSLIYLAHFNYNNMNPITRNIILVTSGVYLVVILASAYKLLQLNLKHAEKTKKLQTKILETQLKLKEQELQYLKMQIHPHFLFNTLNTMYGFALKKADETPEMILKLSNLLDYLLYQVDKPAVLLTEEIEHIKDYIALEKMRFNATLNCIFNCMDIPETAKVTPMILLPFVENSFKHGNLINGKLDVFINISCIQNTVYFSIENTCLKNDDSNAGIGLQNIQKRLDLLYKYEHTLNITTTASTYMVNLTLNLS